MSFEPGSLVTLRGFNLTSKKPIEKVEVYDSPAGEDFWFWTKREIGLFLETEDPVNCDSYPEMARVLHKGRVGWVYEEFLRNLSEEDR